MLATRPTRADYDRAFAREQQNVYPAVDAYERAMGFALDTGRLWAAARVLACPVKAHPPNWQHGRVLYAATRQYLDGATWPINCLDIGTAKGFSALCLRWAINDAGRTGEVVSVDVLHPWARVARNTVAEVDGLQTLAEILAPWPAAMAIRFERSTGVDWLERHAWRIHVAFVDGAHTSHVVRREGALLAKCQAQGDLVIFDDVQIAEVSIAVASLLDQYRIEYLEVLPSRQYALAVRR